jgi:hypothetical protein
MVNVNGVNVELHNAVPRRIASGWLHTSQVWTPEGSHVGTLSAVWSQKHGGTVRSRWAVLAEDPYNTIHGANLNDLVSRWKIGRGC